MFVFIILLLLGSIYAQSDIKDVPVETREVKDSIPPFDADYFFLKSMRRHGDSAFSLDSVAAILDRERKRKKMEYEQKLEKMSFEDLFQAAFKTERFRAHYFMVQFTGDGKNFGNTEVFYDSAYTSFTFYSVPFSQYLDSILIQNERPRVNGSDGLFNSNQLKELGFKVNLNEYVYELGIELPAEMKVLQRISFSKAREPIGSPIKPAFVSFYANLYATENFSCLDYGDRDKDCRRSAVFLNSDGAFSLGGFVLESNVRFKEPEKEETWKETLKRGDLRLVKDIYSINSRLTLGDVGGVSNLMVYEPLAGIRFEHNERMFSRNMITERHKVNFYLPRASQVEIHIDGKLNRRLFMPSGYHEISGLTGHTGLNTVQVFIADDDDNLREVRYDFELGDTRTLTKGERRYSLTGGIKRVPVNTPASFRYRPDTLGLNAEYIYGLFHSLSAGFLWQVSQQNTMTGLQILSANPLGYTELFGLMNADSSKIGRRADLRHNINIGKPFKYMEHLDFSLSGYIQNSTYNPYLFRPLNYVESNFAGVSGNIGTSFWQSHVSAHVGLSFNRESENKDFMDKLYGVAVSKNIYGFSLNANASSSFSKNYSSYHFSLNAGYTFGIKKHRINLNGNMSGHSYEMESQYMKNPDYKEPSDFNYETDYEENEYLEIPGSSGYNLHKRATLGWSWSDGGNNTGGQNYSASVGMQNDLDNWNAKMNGRYLFNRIEMGLGSNFYKYENVYGNRQSYGAGARAGTSFMFADGLWAFGRPVQRGFVLADVNSSLAGSTVRVNYSNAYELDFSRSGSLGSAYQNRITNYHPTTINIRLNDIPEGAWLEQNQYYVMGDYKQGYALRLGNNMRTFIQTRFIGERGALSNHYVAIFQIDSDNKIVNKRTTFTAKNGTFQIGNLIPGEKYRFGFDPSTYIKDIEIEIPKDSGPFLELPVIKVEYK